VPTKFGSCDDLGKIFSVTQKIFRDRLGCVEERTEVRTWRFTWTRPYKKLSSEAGQRYEKNGGCRFHKGILPLGPHQTYTCHREALL
jgi:hypothetical protein